MMWNLLSNAIKFSEKGGAVQVRLVPINCMSKFRSRIAERGSAPIFCHSSSKVFARPKALASGTAVSASA